jgi:hypothetical protein
MTNNLQRVYLEETNCIGDDETTIVFTQNVTRIVETKAREDDEVYNEVTGNDNNEANEYESLSLQLAPTFFKTIREMMTLPVDHSVWYYMNPTIYHLDRHTYDNDLLERKDQHVRDFQNWLDGTLFVNQELK